MHELASEIWIARAAKQWDKVESYARQWLAQEPTSIFAIQLIGKALENKVEVKKVGCMLNLMHGSCLHKNQPVFLQLN